MPLEPHQQRVVAEKAELDERLSRLEAFTVLSNEVYVGLPAEEKWLLTQQMVHMGRYSEVLRLRLELWGVPRDGT